MPDRSPALRGQWADAPSLLALPRQPLARAIFAIQAIHAESGHMLGSARSVVIRRVPGGGLVPNFFAS